MLPIAFAFGLIAIQAVESVRRIVAREGSNVTLFHRPGGFVPGTADAEQIMTYPMSNFNPRIVYINASCRDVKENGGKDIKVATNVTGELKQEYQVNADESEYGRVEYTRHHGLQGGSWNIYGINRHDFDNLYILCTKGNGRDGTLTYEVDDFVRLKERVNTTLMGTTPTTPVRTNMHLTTAGVDQPSTKSPKMSADGLGGGEVAAIGIGCLVFSLIVAGVAWFCINRTRQGRPEGIVYL